MKTLSSQCNHRMWDPQISASGTRKPPTSHRPNPQILLPQIPPPPAALPFSLRQRWLPSSLRRRRLSSPPDQAAASSLGPSCGGILKEAAATLPSSLRRHEFFPHRCRMKTTTSSAGVKELAEQGARGMTTSSGRGRRWRRGSGVERRRRPRPHASSRLPASDEGKEGGHEWSWRAAVASSTS